MGVCHSKSKRRFKGSTITETGPALFILFIFIFFPLLDLLSLAFIYGAGWYVNHLYVRELAVRRERDSAAVASEINQSWRQSGIFQFLGATDPVHGATYIAGMLGQPGTVRGDTTVDAKPFVAVPFFSQVPGLGARCTLRYSSERPREETR